MPNQKSKPAHRETVDVAVVLALDEEYQALSRNQFFSTRAKVTRDNIATAHFDYRDGAGKFRRGVIVRVDGMADQARDAVHILHQRFDATYWISAGISGALSKDVHPGDVIISDVVTSPLEVGKAVPHGDGFDIALGGGRPVVGSQAAKTVFQRWRDDDAAQATFKRNSEMRLDQIKDLVSGEARDIIKRLRDGPGPQTRFGPIASGPVLSASEEFKRKILSSNRKLLAYDMETNEVGGALASLNEAARFFAVRVVSDYGDADKNRFEDDTKGMIRSWALRGLTDLLVFALRDGLPAPQRQRRVASNAPASPPARVKPEAAKHLGARSGPDPTASFWDQRYGSLVGEEPSQPFLTPLSDLDAALESARRGAHTTVVVAGPGGIGKSPLLALLEARWAGPEAIKVSAANHASWHGEGEAVVISAETYVERLNLDGEEPKLVLIDDVDLDDEPTRILIAELNRRAQTGSGTCMVFAVAADEPLVDRFPESVTVDYWLPLKGVSARSPEFERFVDSFDTILSTVQPGITSSDLRNRIAELAPSSVDLQFISVLVGHWADARAKSLRTATQFASYAARLLGATAIGKEPPTDFIELCEIDAFARYIGDVPPKLPDGSIEKAYLKVRASGEWIQEALVASFAVKAVQNAGANGISDLTPLEQAAICRVYDTRVSSLVKQVVHTSDGAKILAGVEKLIYGCDVAVMPFLVYILGRIKDRHQGKAMELLREHRSAAFDDFPKWKNSSQDPRLTALAKRAVYISLAYLGDREAAEAYVQLLARDPAESALNRGFHLEYYRDLIVRPRAGLDGYMLSDVDSKKWDRAYQVLSENIGRELENGALTPKGIIELGTFCSFVAERLDLGGLAADHRAPIGALLKLALHLGNCPATLAGVCDALVHELSKPPRTGAYALFETVYELKHEERAGWRKRQVGSRLNTPTERVASHIYAACLLALWLLPDKPSPDFTYSKARVIKLLMLHDVGEAITGDLTPDEKGEDHAAEAKAVARIAGMSMMPALHNLHDLLKDWQDFEDAGSNDAKLARDIDYLEALMQGTLYRPYFPTAANYEEFVGYHRSRIRTPPGRVILDAILRGDDLATASKHVWAPADFRGQR